jgi:hypothetical protein
MTTLIDDEMLGTFAVVGEPGKVGAQIVARFGASSTVSPSTRPTPDDAVRADIVEGVKATGPQP